MKHETLAGMTWDVCGPANDWMVATVDLDRGRVSITGAAHAAAGRPSAVLVLYSAQNKCFGLKPASPRDHSTLVISGPTVRAGKRIAARMLARRMMDDGYSGKLSVPLQWHPDGLLWGDLTMARRTQNKAANGGAE